MNLKNDPYEISFAAIRAAVARRRLLVAGCTIALTAAVVGIVVNLPASYSSEAVILIDTRKNKLNDLQSVLSGLALDSGAITSEVDVLKSDSLARSVAQKLDYVDSAEFHKTGAFDRLGTFLGNVEGALPGFLQGPVKMVASGIHGLLSRPKPASSNPEAEAIASLQSHLTVSHEPRTFTITIRYTSADPAWAAKVINTYADSYVDAQVATKAKAVKEASAWLSDQVKDLRTRVMESDAAVENFRRAHQLGSAKDGASAQQQLVELNTQLVAARGDTAQAQARYQQAQQLAKNGLGDASDSASEVLNSPLIQRLREQQATLLRRQAELGTVYGNRHPEMTKVRSEVADLDGKIKQEVRRIGSALRSDLQAAQARERTLETNAHALEQKVAGLGQWEGQLKVLTREADANHSLYENFLTKYRELNAQDTSMQPDSHVISKGFPASKPSQPNRVLLSAGGALVSLFVAILIAVLCERRMQGFRNTEEAKLALGIRALGITPRVLGREIPHEDVGEVILSQPTHPYSEKVRSIQTAIAVNRQGAPRSVLVTSAAPGEGKTTLAVSIARTIAASGQRCVLVDTDLRRPRVHRLLGGRIGPGVCEILDGQTTAQYALQRDTKSPLMYLSAGGTNLTAPALLDESSCRMLLESVSDLADVVILDSAPVMAVSDAFMLSSVVDAAVLAVRWGSTPRDVAVDAVRQMRDLDLPVLGFVLTQVDVTKLLGNEVDRYSYHYASTYQRSKAA